MALYCSAVTLYAIVDCDNEVFPDAQKFIRILFSALQQIDSIMF